MNEKYCSIIQIYILSISMHIQNLIELYKLIHKILSINKTLIKGSKSVKNWPKITCIRYNMDLVYINEYTKFYKNPSVCSEDIEKKHILHESRTITLLFINECRLFAIWNHSSLISMSMQSLQNIDQKLFTFKPETKRWWTYRQTDGRTDRQALNRFEGYNTITRHIFVAGHKNEKICVN